VSVDPDSAQRSIERAARRLVYMTMWPFDDISEARALSSRITAALLLGRCRVLDVKTCYNEMSR